MLFLVAILALLLAFLSPNRVKKMRTKRRDLLGLGMILLLILVLCLSQLLSQS